MQLDELKQAWAAHGELLQRSLAIDERLLREVMLRKVRVALGPFVLGRAVEVVVGMAILLIVVARVLAAHAGEPRYVVVGGAFAVFTCLITALSAYLVIEGLRLDYAGPVTAIQRAVERIKVAEYRALKWALLGGVVFWLPATLFCFEAVTGVDVLAQADLAWLTANLVFGLFVLAAGQALSKRYMERTDLGPRARRLADALSGRALRSASGHLAELGTFEREERPAR